MKIIIDKKNNYLEIRANSVETTNLIERRFSIYVNENYRWMTAVKEKRWDGKIPFMTDGRMKIGLLHELLTFCKNVGIDYTINFKAKNKISHEKLKAWIETLNLPKNRQLRDYQYKIFYDLLVYNRISAQSEMGSGKSLIIYLILRFMLKHDIRTMLIVPNIDLLYQMRDDFISYGWKDTNKYLQIIGDTHRKKEFDKPIIISTWQSLNAKRLKLYNQILGKRKKELTQQLVKDKLPELEHNNIFQAINFSISLIKKKITVDLKKFKINSIKYLFKKNKDIFPEWKEINNEIDQFEINIQKDFDTLQCVIGDESDTSTGEALSHVLEKCSKTQFRLGLTGTMPIKEWSNWYTIIANFGKYKQYNTYRDLADKGLLSDITIKLNYFNYNVNIKKDYHENVDKSNYREALYYMSKLDCRNDEIVSKVHSLKNKNILLMFQFKEGEGHNYYKFFKDKFKRKLFYIDGDISNRKNLIKQMKAYKGNYICLGSMKTMSRGINIPNLTNIFLLSSLRNRESLFQLIGRLSRLFGNNKAVFEDIIDNLVMEDEGGNLLTNLSIKHHFDRIEVYKERKYKMKKVETNIK